MSVFESSVEAMNITDFTLFTLYCYYSIKDLVETVYMFLIYKSHHTISPLGVV